MNLKISILSAVAASFLIATSAMSQNVELTKLGAAALNVDGGLTSAGYSQTSTALTFTNFSSGNNILAGFFAAQPLDWSAYTNAPYTNFALNMSFSGVNPDTDFFVDFYSSTGIIDTYTASTVGLTGSLSLVNLSFNAGGNGEYNDVIGISFSWNGELASPNTITVESAYAVPEPSTYALLALSGLALGVYALRRRRTA